MMIKLFVHRVQPSILSRRQEYFYLKFLFGIGTGKARTINMKDAITDKLRYQDGRSREMDEIFKAQDRQLESTGRQITSDRLELRRSDNIKSSDEMRAERELRSVNSRLRRQITDTRITRG